MHQPLLQPGEFKELEAGFIRLLEVSEDCMNFSSAIESIGNGYEPGEEPTDFNKLFDDEIAKLKASSSLVPQNDPLFRQFTTAIWASTILEYDLGAERDLFEAPKLIIEEPMIGLYPITAIISMISGGEHVISTQAQKVVDIESMQNEQQHL